MGVWEFVGTTLKKNNGQNTYLYYLFTSLIKVFFKIFFNAITCRFKMLEFNKIITLGCQKFENYPNFLWHLNFLPHHLVVFTFNKMMGVWGCQCDVLHEVGLSKVEKRGSMKVS